MHHIAPRMLKRRWLNAVLFAIAFALKDLNKGFMHVPILAPIRKAHAIGNVMLPFMHSVTARQNETLEAVNITVQIIPINTYK